jgi:hypothetical protein
MNHESISLVFASHLFTPRVRVFAVRFAPRVYILAMGILHCGHVNACKSTCILEFTRATSQQQQHHSRRGSRVFLSLSDVFLPGSLFYSVSAHLHDKRATDCHRAARCMHVRAFVCKLGEKKHSREQFGKIVCECVFSTAGLKNQRMEKLMRWRRRRHLPFFL